MINHVHQLIENRGTYATYEFVPVSFEPIQQKTATVHVTTTATVVPPMKRSLPLLHLHPPKNKQKQRSLVEEPSKNDSAEKALKLNLMIDGKSVQSKSTTTTKSFAQSKQHGGKNIHALLESER